MNSSNTSAGVLYIVATPIGNLEDISQRAIQLLKSVDLIAVEDTRHSSRLLQHYGVTTPMQAYHDFNEGHAVANLMSRIAQGQNIALISDAGTPLISDPGYQLVKQARTEKVKVIPVPGASAVIAALSVAGLPSDRFTFEGFLPAKTTARLSVLESLGNEKRTMIFYEAPHRILSSLEDMKITFGGERRVVVARELTKQFETIISDTLEHLVKFVKEDENQQRGELVVIVSGKDKKQDQTDPEIERTLRILLEEGLPVKQVAAIAAKITGSKKNQLYELALTLKDQL